MNIHGIEVKGKVIDAFTRCEHYDTEKDIIAIKFPCCRTFYPCYECHEACADHRAERWPSGSDSEKAVLCGSCGHRLTIAEYQGCGYVCPHCLAAFNPRCGRHAHLYFEVHNP
ncbi:MAG TPA: CHY zinc finger protein [Bacillales bacterium]|nr:CHY zinc finger protein [Bacillales bacterium]